MKRAAHRFAATRIIAQRSSPGLASPTVQTVTLLSTPPRHLQAKTDASVPIRPLIVTPAQRVTPAELRRMFLQLSAAAGHLGFLHARAKQRPSHVPRGHNLPGLAGVAQDGSFAASETACARGANRSVLPARSSQQVAAWTSIFSRGALLLHSINARWFLVTGFR